MVGRETSKFVAEQFESDLKRIPAEKKKLVEDALEDAINVFVESVLAYRNGEAELAQRDFALIALLAAYNAAMEVA
jgi:exonuclease VII small subunit